MQEGILYLDKKPWIHRKFNSISMKKILLTASLLIAIFSCKKSQEETANNLLLNIMTAGEWRMEGFTETGINTIAQWSGYTFRYYDTYRVDAKKKRHGSIYRQLGV